jgi:DNA polymerase-3 subunit delta'
MDSIIGHQSVIQKISNSFSKDNFNHAHLFLGPEYIGKKTTAKFLSAKILSVENAEAHPDYSFFDASLENSTQNIREFLSSISGKPIAGHTRVVVMDNLNSLSLTGINSLLKFLEEPSSTCILFLIAHQKPISTIISRCEVSIFFPLSEEEMSNFITKKKLGGVEDQTVFAGRPGLTVLFGEDKKLFKQTSDAIKMLWDSKNLPLFSRINYINHLASFEVEVLSLAVLCVMDKIKKDLTKEPANYVWLDKLMIFLDSLKTSANKKLIIEQLLLAK